METELVHSSVLLMQGTGTTIPWGTMQTEDDLIFCNITRIDISMYVTWCVQLA